MALRQFEDDTIAAIATPPGEGGLGVIRMSGGRALAVADKIFVSHSKKLPSKQKTFTAQVGRVVSLGGRTIDEAVLLVMRAPKSYTCEDVVEISAHGGTAVLRAILESAVRAGARLAAPGEFTKRAFLNGRIDLLQAEAVLDLIQAKTELSRRHAGAQLEGRLSGQIREMREELLNVLSHLEAAIDFPDDHLQTDSISKTGETIERLLEKVNRLLAGSEMGLLAKRGVKVVITGSPNAGKSSLMNRLAGKNRVIVAPEPGTTRDLVEEEIELGGFPVRLVDTAGIQETTNPVEKEGIARARVAIEGADLVLLVLDGSRDLGAGEADFVAGLNGKPKVVAVNKKDLPLRLDLERVGRLTKTPALRCSCVEEGGTENLEKELLRLIRGGKPEVSDEVVISSIRQKDILEKVSQDLEGARRACQKSLSSEFVASDIRPALDRLGELVGETVTEDLLERLFSRFCIGK
ncbi:MAG: tRNA uridine-5-carboxymethylaminomethyl(34) synthesis GTPase MnmE [Candidatus Omnitrophica bacterium]|nr:tRNA uridine-5-carboxymethylaminomethyl(34) synthesis GTPase MnmE [Candidatus Omnitrophota bacterium]